MSQKKNKRKIDILVLSDIHLGTYGCHAKELLLYLKSINPKVIILNGDIIDIWQFNKRYWPKSHMKIVKHLIGLISKGVEMHYITGNHDEMLRKFDGFQLGTLSIKNKLIIELDGKKSWFFHGDIFDVTMQHSKWLAKLGSIGYDMLILINKAVNFCSEALGKGKISLSKKIKDSVKSAVKFINDFEQIAADIAIENGFDYVVCGHIHQPTIKKIKTENGQIEYLNSGDWIENLTALEYSNKSWEIYKYADEHFSNEIDTDDIDITDLVDKSNKEIFGQLIAEFNFKKS